LKDVRADDLASIVLRALVERGRLDPSLVDDIYFGCSNQGGEDNRNIARMASLLSGFPYTVPGTTVNRLCGSGLEAISDAARVVMAGEGEILIAGGVESMTRAPLVSLKPEKEFARGGLELVDSTIGWRFVNPKWPAEYPPISMGETAENLAEKFSLAREVQDEYSYQSHMKAVKATDNGTFGEEIVNVQVPGGEVVNRDEGPRRDTTVEKLRLLKPAFRKGGTVTAGNSSGINDGAAGLLITSEEKAHQLGLEPIARILGSATAGVHPSFMGLGPVPATKKLLSRLNMSMDDFDLVELNEAFAAQVLACFEQMSDLRPDLVNPNGGAIALGHPIGCSGARIAVTLLHQMRRTNAKRGLATMCIGVGQGIAAAFELIP
jgi:acetyl-CoA acetyltransferase family protein